MRISGSKIAGLILSIGTLIAAAPQEFPPLPSELPVLAPAQQPPVRRVVPVGRPPRQLSLPQFPQRPMTNAAPRPYQPVNVGEDILKWDAVEKEINTQPGDLSAEFSFALTNVSTTNVVINWVRPSCGCTVAKLPPTPWTLTPGEGGKIDFSLDLRGKYGTLNKYVSIDTSHGQKMLTIKVHIPQAAPGVAAGMDSRVKNMQLAMADRQVVFRGDCAACHATPTVGKKGEQLYTAACAICHDTPNRATMVPDLHALKKATGKEYWTFWIANGKPGTLMPGFSKAHGGPLDQEQIQSLAEFMFEKFPSAETVTAAASGKPPTSAPLGTLTVKPGGAGK